MRLKPIYAEGQRTRGADLFRLFGRGDWNGVRALGIGAGDALLVHSGFGGPADFSARLAM